MIIGISADHANKIERTGVGNVCLALIQALKKQIPVSEQVVLYSARPLIAELADLPSNWQCKILRWPWGKLWTQIRLSWELFFYPPDIFFAPGQLVPFICPKKTIAIIHDSAFLAIPAAYNFWGRQYLQWMNKLIIKKTWKIITASEFNKKEIEKYYGQAIADKTVIIPFAYDKDRYCAMTRAKCRFIKPCLVFIGRLEIKKNTANLIRAFNILKNKFDLQIILAGTPGVGFVEVEYEINNSPFKKDIIMPGFVGSENLSALLSGAEAFVFPSQYEGFGLPILEAMASGCPVIAADIPALREVGGKAVIYTDGGSAELLANSVAEVLSDDRLKDQLRVAGLERIKNFSWQQTAEQTIDVFNS